VSLAWIFPGANGSLLKRKGYYLIMVNNYDATIRALATFILTNAPVGAPRDLACLEADLAEGRVQDYICLEFRPTEDTGCTLYVRVAPPDGRWTSKYMEDSEGNQWSAYRVKCDVSWSSWGSADIKVCQRRLAVMTETLRFACEVERAFPDVFHSMDATAEEVQLRKAELVKERAKGRLAELVKSHAKGMKIGQEKTIKLSESLVPSEADVERSECGRSFKYHAKVVGVDTFHFTRVA
jgi:hypothetical protein